MIKQIERNIRDQYARYFKKSDWHDFKYAADYYFETAAKILTKDIKYEKKHMRLLRRNVQKRLYIGIGCELLLKAFFLKNGYWINRKKSKPNNNFPHKIREYNEQEFKKDDTLSFLGLISGVNDIEDFGSDKIIVENGLMIAKVFRDKEAHVVVINHVYDPKNYQDIEKTLVIFYKKAFLQNLELKFSVGKERATFRINDLIERPKQILPIP